MIVLALTFGAALSVMGAIILSTLYENDRISPSSPIGWLLIPAPVRALEPIAQCAPLRYSRSFHECGGICGEFVGINFGTTASLEDLRNSYPLTPLLAGTGFEEGVISLDRPRAGDPPGCNRAYIELYDDFTRTAR